MFQVHFHNMPILEFYGARSKHAIYVVLKIKVAQIMINHVCILSDQASEKEISIRSLWWNLVNTPHAMCVSHSWCVDPYTWQFDGILMSHFLLVTMAI